MPNGIFLYTLKWVQILRKPTDASLYTPTARTGLSPRFHNGHASPFPLLPVVITVFVTMVCILAYPHLLKAAPTEDPCIDCHNKYTPRIVKDWLGSEMSKQTEKEISCAACHGEEHQTETDFDKAVTPTAATCEECHKERVAQFKKGKHSQAWKAISTMPMLADHPQDLIAGEKGCGGCHSIGREDGQCDSCHTRHRFSREEARRPEACLPCHMGFDHGQWEMSSSSKHGVIYRVDRESGRAPVCQTCHMPQGSHGVSTSWGYFALRLPEPDSEWKNYRKSIFKGLGILNPDGTTRSWDERVERGQLFTISLLEEWTEKREKMISICSQCHAENYARDELKKCDEILKQSDKLMSEAIEIVADLYKEGYLKRAKDYPAFPDLMRFYEIPTSIEQRLFTMLMHHRMRAFQGAFHTNPEYTLWHGWAELKKDLFAIREEAQLLRERTIISNKEE
jgi:hypothetical protein